jgi:Beta-ketoacyl synthase, N-terminal domain
MSTRPARQDGPPVTDPPVPDPPVPDLTGADLTVLARAAWPAREGDVLPAIPGFIASSFSPLVAELADRCLGGYFGTRPADQARGESTAVVLASRTGDLATAAAVAQAVDAGQRVPPLLFYQSSPNAVVGHLTARWGLAGPVVCTSPACDALEDALRGAAALIGGGEAAAVLVIAAEQGRPGTGRDHGTAILVGPRSWPPAARQEGDDEDPGN